MQVDKETLLEVFGEIGMAHQQNWSKLTDAEVAILNHQIGQLKAAVQPIKTKREDADRRIKGTSL